MLESTGKYEIYGQIQQIDSVCHKRRKVISIVK